MEDPTKTMSLKDVSVPYRSRSCVSYFVYNQAGGLPKRNDRFTFAVSVQWIVFQNDLAVPS